MTVQNSITSLCVKSINRNLYALIVQKFRLGLVAMDAVPLLHLCQGYEDSCECEMVHWQQIVT